MATKFVLRGEDTQDNPFAARLYGRGLTQGQVVFYENKTFGTETRTKFLAILCQGARFRDDLGCSKAIRVFYAGFELPELLPVGVPQWKFHKGTVASAPDYKPITAIDATANTFTSPNHGYANGDKVAFHGRGADVALPTAAVGTIGFHTQWIISVIDADTFKVHRQKSGAPDNGLIFDLTSTGANIDRLFVWQGDTWLFDPQQGRPYFFSTLDFTFSGLTYIEIYLPPHLSTGEDEPSNLKVVLEGKELRQIANVGGVVAFTTDVTAEPNNALVSVDTLHFDGKLPLERLDGASFVAWRDRADATIPWVGGNNNPAQPASYTLTNMTYDVAANRLTHAGGGGNAYAYTGPFTSTVPSLEARYNGSSFILAFSQTNVPGATTQQGIYVSNGMLYYLSGSTQTQIIAIYSGDIVRIAYLNGILKIYLNGVEMPLLNVSQTQLYTTYYTKIVIQTAAGYIDRVFIAPSGTDAVPRQVKRFEGHLAIIEPLPAIDVFNAEMHMTPGCDWADIDGKVQIAVEPDRTPCFTFRHDPDNYDVNDPDTYSNIHKLVVKRRSLEDTPNFYRFTFRDGDDPILKRKPVFIDRKDKRALLGGRLVDSGLIPYGVMTQSQMERIGETRARLESDLDIGFTVEAFLDSLTVVKGSFVNLIDPTAGYTAASPALCKVNDVRFNDDDVEAILYELTIITNDYYSDTAHGAVIPVSGVNPAIRFLPPPIAEALTLFETTEPLPDGSIISSISGTVEFAPALSQHARIFERVFLDTDRIGLVTLNSGTDVFTLVGTVPSGTTAVALLSTSDTYPEGYDKEISYYVVNVSGLTFQLSRTVSGAPDTFTTDGADLYLYPIPTWRDTRIDVIPDVTGFASFELFPVFLSYTQVRAVTRSAADASLAFEVHRTAQVQITGDLTAPAAPTNLRTYYDGISLTWEWDASSTVGVREYRVTDEFNRILAVTSQPIYIELAKTETLTRRIYAVNPMGIVSTTYATATFVKPFRFQWTEFVLSELNADFTLTVTSTAVGYRGAVLGTAAILKPVDTRIYISPGLNTRRQGIALSPALTWFPTLAFNGVFFNDDGTYGTFPSNSSFGSYNAGDKFVFVLKAATENLSLYKRIPQSDGRVLESLVHSYGTIDLSTVSHYYIKAYTDAGIGAIIDLQPTIVGNLSDNIHQIPASAQNLVNATYDVTTGTATRTSGAGWGSSGLSISGIPANQAGGYYFYTPGGSGVADATGVTIGLSDADPDANTTSMDFRIVVTATGELECYSGDTLLTTIALPAQDGTSALLGVEQIFIGRGYGGNPYVTVDDDFVYEYTTAPTALKTGAVILDIAFNGSLGAAWQVDGIRLVKPYTTQLTPDGEVPTLTMALTENALAGKNTVYDIPKFNPNDFTVGEALVVQPDFSISSEPVAAGMTVGDAVTGGGANRILYQDASGNLAADANFTYDGRLTVRRTTEQQRWEYDAANYLSLTVGATGTVNFTASRFQFQIGSNLAFDVQAPSGSGGVWVDMDTNGYAAIGHGGAGNHVWIGRAYSSGQFFTDASAGDILMRNTAGSLLFGNSGSDAGMALTGNKLGIGVKTATAQLHVRATTEQLRLDYDASNYFSTTVSSAGEVNFDGVGMASAFRFKKPLVATLNQANTTTVPYVGLRNEALGYGSWGFAKYNSNDLAVVKGIGTDAPTTVAAWFEYNSGRFIVNSTSDNGANFQVGGSAWFDEGTLTVTKTDATSGDYQWLQFFNKQSGYGSWAFCKTGANDFILKCGAGSNPSGPLFKWDYVGATTLYYDVSNYFSTTVSSAGTVTFNAVGSAAWFKFQLGGTEFTRFLGRGAAGAKSLFLGYLSGNLTGTGNQNTGVGEETLKDLTTGYQNLAFGHSAQRKTTTGWGNVGIGFYALANNLDGAKNVAIGSEALGTGASGSDNVAIGFQSMAIGAVTGAYNVAVGTRTLEDVTSGSYNTALGSFALANISTGNYHVGIGYSALIAATTGLYNVAVGPSAGQALTTGGSNTLVGFQSGYAVTGNYNTMVGTQAGYSTTGSSNTFIGYLAGYFETGSNKLYIANDYRGNSLIYGEFPNALLRFNTPTVEQNYDGSNYFSTTVSSAGTVTFDAVGSGAKFVFSDAIKQNVSSGGLDNFLEVNAAAVGNAGANPVNPGVLFYRNTGTNAYAYGINLGHDGSEYGVQLFAHDSAKILFSSVGAIGNPLVNQSDLTVRAHIDLTDGSANFNGKVTVPDDAFAAGWNGDLSVPTKNAIWDGLLRRITQNGTDTNPSATGSDEYLYTFTVPANTMKTNGDGLHAYFVGYLAKNGNQKQIKVLFAGQTIFDSTTLTDANIADFVIDIDIYRTSNTEAKCVTRVQSQSYRTVSYLLVNTGLDFTTSEDLILVGNVTTATSDMTARFGALDYIPKF